MAFITITLPFTWPAVLVAAIYEWHRVRKVKWGRQEARRQMANTISEKQRLVPIFVERLHDLLNHFRTLQSTSIQSDASLNLIDEFKRLVDDAVDFETQRLMEESEINAALKTCEQNAKKPLYDERVEQWYTSNHAHYEKIHAAVDRRITFYISQIDDAALHNLAVELYRIFVDYRLQRGSVEFFKDFIDETNHINFDSKAIMNVKNVAGGSFKATA